jgi:hypothetical protein
MRGVFTIEERNRVRDRILALAEADPRIVSGAILGSLALGPGDRWSDLDLSFAVSDDASVDEVLAEWTETVGRELDGVHHFDLARGHMIYRVFLLPGLLQFDLSLGPQPEFGARGPKFRLLFGSADEVPQIEPDDAHELFGLSVHHAVRARFCIERGKLWEAQYWINELRDHALALACRRRGLETTTGAATRICRPSSSPTSRTRSSGRSSATSSCARSIARSMGCFGRPTRCASWRPRSNRRCATSPTSMRERVSSPSGGPARRRAARSWRSHRAPCPTRSCRRGLPSTRRSTR